MFYDILDKKRLEILPLLKVFKDRFYLAGGTGLALQLGHRDSIDFDFFTAESFDTEAFYAELLEIFSGRKIVKVLESRDSLDVIIDGKIKLSFLRYPYVLLKPALNEENFKIASIEDIACMKLSAIVSRATLKDYADLYFVMNKVSLLSLLEMARQKMPDLDQNLILKSLVYFEDIAKEHIVFKHNFEVSFTNIKKFLEQQVKKIL
jgi:hypothetical protein